MNNLANKKKVTVTLWDSISHMNAHDVFVCEFYQELWNDYRYVGKYSPTFQGTLNDFLKENDNLDSDEMKEIDQLKVNGSAYLSSGQSWMVLRRDS